MALSYKCYNIIPLMPFLNRGTLNLIFYFALGWLVIKTNFKFIPWPRPDWLGPEFHRFRLSPAAIISFYSTESLQGGLCAFVALWLNFYKTTSFHREMALFPMSCVLRELTSSTYISTPRRKLLCGLLNTLWKKSSREIPQAGGAHRNNRSFPNWKLIRVRFKFQIGTN